MKHSKPINKKKILIKIYIFIGLILLVIPILNVCRLDNKIDKNLNEIYNNRNRSIIKNSKEVYKPNIGDIVGTISMNRLNKEIPLLYGATKKTLEGGACIFEGTKLFDEGSPLIMGHRDTVFYFLKNVKIGDEFIINYLDVCTTYIVKSIEIVPKEDEDYLMKNIGNNKLKLITCYPFNFLGPAPERYLIILNIKK